MWLTILWEQNIVILGKYEKYEIVYAIMRHLFHHIMKSNQDIKILALPESLVMKVKISNY